MKLLWQDLTFWNKQQILIVKWLDEDYKKMSNISFIEKLKTKNDLQEKINYIKQLLSQNKNAWTAKHIKSLNITKIRNIIDWIIEPMLLKNKEEYEKNFDTVIIEKRKNEINKLQKKYPNKQITLDY